MKSPLEISRCLFPNWGDEQDFLIRRIKEQRVYYKKMQALGRYDKSFEAFKIMIFLTIKFSQLVYSGK